MKQNKKPKQTLESAQYGLEINFKRRQDLESCPLNKILPFTICDKQVIASALGQLRINFTCIFKVFQISLVASRLGQFCENFENTREINP